jgi:hypothetical protein
MVAAVNQIEIYLEIWQVRNFAVSSRRLVSHLLDHVWENKDRTE